MYKHDKGFRFQSYFTCSSEVKIILFAATSFSLAGFFFLPPEHVTVDLRDFKGLLCDFFEVINYQLSLQLLELVVSFGSEYSVAGAEPTCRTLAPSVGLHKLHN